MPTLFVANTSKQNHDFVYRLAEETNTRQQHIRAGEQARIGNTDWDMDVIQRIIKQHRPYGLTFVGDLKSTRDFVGLCYNINKPVELDVIYTQFSKNDEALNDDAEKRREVEAASFAKVVENKFSEAGTSLSRVEMETVEQPVPGAPQPSVAAGFEVTRDGVQTRHNTKSSKRKR